MRDEEIQWLPNAWTIPMGAEPLHACPVRTVLILKSDSLVLLGVLIVGVDNVATHFQITVYFWWDPCSVLVPDRHSRLQSVGCSGFGCSAYNVPSPSVTSAKLLCKSPVFVSGFSLPGLFFVFFQSTNMWRLLCLYFKKQKQWWVQQYSLNSSWISVVELEAKMSFQFSIS